MYYINIVVIGTSDFFGLNTYTSRLVEHFDQPNKKPTYFKDQDVKYTMDPNWQYVYATVK